jgi:hypothetical protein
LSIGGAKLKGGFAPVQSDDAETGTIQAHQITNIPGKLCALKLRSSISEGIPEKKETSLD